MKLEKQFGKYQIAQLPVSQWKTILALAYSGPQTAYSLATKYRMKYPVVNRALHGLKDLGWIKVIERKMSSKNVKTIKYGLTAEGLLWVISRRPSEWPPELVEKIWNKPAFSESHPEKTDEVTEDISPIEDITDLVSDLDSQEDVHMHLLLEFDEEKIAESNADLFPWLFKPWQIHKKRSVTGTMEFHFPALAFSSLVEYYEGIEGLRENYKTLDLIFAYKVYRKVVEHMAENSAKAYSTRAVGVDFVKESTETTSQWIDEVSKVVPELRVWFTDIVKELKTRFTTSLSIVTELEAVLDK